MREVNLGSYITFFISEGVFKEFYSDRTPEEIESFQREIMGYMEGDFEEHIPLPQVPKDIRGRLKLLHAHEIVPSEQWSFRDDGNEYPVQQWVDSMDGTAEVLIITCCNTLNATLTARRSLVIYPASAFNLYGAMYGEVPLNISIPHGY